MQTELCTHREASTVLKKALYAALVMAVRVVASEKHTIKELARLHELVDPHLKGTHCDHLDRLTLAPPLYCCSEPKAPSENSDPLYELFTSSADEEEVDELEILQVGTVEEVVEVPQVESAHVG